MDRKLSDRQVDRIAKTLLQDFALDDAALDEIAESPRLWWNVRSGIEAEKTRRERALFASFRPRILAFGAAAILVCCGLAILFSSFSKNSDLPVAEKNPLQNPTAEIAKLTESSPGNSPEIDSGEREESKNSVPEKSLVKNAAPKNRFIARNQKREKSADRTNSPSKLAPEIQREETKTDFIALSYAGDTESGQIVRVKVPGAMMVSLGLKEKVENESELVQAEVIIGDDGLARAIRFIRN